MRKYTVPHYLYFTKRTRSPKKEMRKNFYTKTNIHYVKCTRVPRWVRLKDLYSTRETKLCSLGAYYRGTGDGGRTNSRDCGRRLRVGWAYIADADSPRITGLLQIENRYR